MEQLLTAILGYFLGLAANLRTDAIVKDREEKLRKQLTQEDSLRRAIASARPLREELRSVCIELVRNRHQLGVSPQEEPLWLLLSDDTFQADILEWFTAGGIAEGHSAEQRLLQRIGTIFAQTNVPHEQIAFLRNGYFEALNKAVFENQILANWRQQLSLDYLRRRADEAAGVYSLERQEAVLSCYCRKSLKAWDIIDLSGLPEDDIQIASQSLLLRQLYMPLRIAVSSQSRSGADDASLARLEKDRDRQRQHQAEHFREKRRGFRSRLEVRASLGKCLNSFRRLVVLGDPGAGKTTVLRWMATAYLLRYKGDDTLSHFPDTHTLPNHPWIPVLIRCRDLGNEDLCRSFPDFLGQHLSKTELLPDEAKILCAIVLDRIAKGEVLLLVDGLDEITNPNVRAIFCQELEQTASRYPLAPIIVTSRIVGYRNMPHRMGTGFKHSVIDELTREDKDRFAKRWIAVTEQHRSEAEKADRVSELIEALHSSDRIERLTGNPMLLTTLALVKRKVGKLPSRRNKLYSEAVSVLLNWNPRHYQIIEEDEAIPQLSYLAYEMCHRGVQRLTGEEVLDLLEKLRREYPNIRAIRRRDPQAFLDLLESRSSILIRSGGIWQRNGVQEKAVWEFRHLTFQEYLAAHAIIDGRYPNREKNESLANHVAPLARPSKATKGVRRRDAGLVETEVPESWGEALRLLVADCRDDDVDEVMLAILKPLNDEPTGETSRPRAVLAALCLADEPNVNEDIAHKIIAALVEHVTSSDGLGARRTLLDGAAIEIAGSMWSEHLKQLLIREFCTRRSRTRQRYGAVWGTAELGQWERSGVNHESFFAGLKHRLGAEDPVEAISAAMTITTAAYEGHDRSGFGLAAPLLTLLLASEPPVRHAATWALAWISHGSSRASQPQPTWTATGHDVDTICRALESTGKGEFDTRYWLLDILGSSKDSQAFDLLVHYLDSPDVSTRIAAIAALRRRREKMPIQPLLKSLADENIAVRRRAILALDGVADAQTVPALLAQLNVSDTPFRVSLVHLLGRLGDKRATEPLISLLSEPNTEVLAATVVAISALDPEQAVCEMTRLLEDQSAGRRKVAVGELVKLRSVRKEQAIVLSQNLNARSPWLDPQVPITEAHISQVAKDLGIATEEIRTRYDSLAAEFRLRLTVD